MQTFTETFDHNGGKLAASLEISEGLTQGWVSGPPGFSATLDWLESEGTLTAEGGEMSVEEETIDEIMDWAVEHGY